MERLRWRDQRPGERVLRAWLGGTLLYAGVQKLADPGFFTRGSTSYIGTQLDGFAQDSPVGSVIDLVNHAPVLAGAAVAMTEILVGVATLAGLLPAIAALVGAGLSVTFWLASSWQVYPYYLGSDTIYAIAWIAYALLLPSTAVALRSLRDHRRPALPAPGEADERRRALLLGGATVAGAIAIGGFAALVGRARGRGVRGSTATADAGSTGGAGAVVAELAALRANGSVDFTDPATGSSVVVALADGTAAAFSRRCTHSGCTASFDRAAALIVCPCHGSRFDPAAGGVPVHGPATRPLTSVPIEIEPQTGVVRRI